MRAMEAPASTRGEWKMPSGSFFEASADYFVGTVAMGISV